MTNEDLKVILIENLRYLNSLNVTCTPKLILHNFQKLLQYDFSKIKLVIVNDCPQLRPDSSGLSCFRELGTYNIPKNRFHDSVEKLLGANYNELQDHYINEGILFLNLSLTSSYDLSEKVQSEIWYNLINKIVIRVDKESNPIWLNIGSSEAYNFIRKRTTTPININKYIGKMDIHLLPITPTYMIDVDDLNKVKQKKLIDLDIRILINDLLEYRKIKKIKWDEI